jgi:hypothetical protein
VLFREATLEARVVDILLARAPRQASTVEAGLEEQGESHASRQSLAAADGERPSHVEPEPDGERRGRPSSLEGSEDEVGDLSSELSKKMLVGAQYVTGCGHGLRGDTYVFLAPEFHRLAVGTVESYQAVHSSQRFRGRNIELKRYQMYLLVGHSYRVRRCRGRSRVVSVSW